MRLGRLSNKAHLLPRPVPKDRFSPRRQTRRGAKRALIAVAHSLLTVAYHVLRDQRPYQQLGADFFDRLNHGRLRSFYVKRLKSLGYQVDVKEAQPVA
jgi:hypothetical protein